LALYGIAGVVVEQQRALVAKLRPPPAVQQPPTPPTVPPPAPSLEEQRKDRREHLRLAQSSLNTRLRDIDTHFRTKSLLEASCERERDREMQRRSECIDMFERLEYLGHPRLPMDYPCLTPTQGSQVGRERIPWIP
jgi:hypothetical protein